MNKTNIEWVKNPDGTQGFTSNSISGCKNHTPEGLCLGGLFPCYAYKLANTRLKTLYLANHNIANWDTLSDVEKVQAYNDPFYPRFWEERLHEPDIEPTKPQHMKGIFVCDMSDLFGIGIPEVWTREVLNIIWSNPWHRFYLLTKQPQNLIKFSPFPENCWVGVTATSVPMLINACKYLRVTKGRVKYISLEPLLEYDGNRSLLFNLFRDAEIGWLILGACTGTLREMVKLCEASNNELAAMRYGKLWTAQPRIEWIREIVEAADKAGVKVFLKDNLGPLLRAQGAQDNRFWRDLRDEKGFEPLHCELRQEMPK